MFDRIQKHPHQPRLISTPLTVFGIQTAHLARTMRHIQASSFARIKCTMHIHKLRINQASRTHAHKIFNAIKAHYHNQSCCLKHILEALPHSKYQESTIINMPDSFRYLDKTWTSPCHPELLCLAIRWNHGHFIILPELDKTKPLVEHRLLHNISNATRERKFETLKSLVEGELFPIIRRLGRKRFEELSPPVPLSSLEALLIPRQYEFRLSNVNGVTQLVEKHSDNAVTLREWPEPLRLPGHCYSTVPRIDATDVDVIAVVQGTSSIAEVRVNDKVMVARWKSVTMGDISRQFYGGLDIAQKAANQNKRVNIPQILGLIQIGIRHSVAYNSNDYSEEEKMVVGVLQTLVIGDIEEKGNVRRNRSIWGMKFVDEIPAERKDRWYTQVKETVQWLHQNGQIWGNSGVVIHGKTDEAWLIGCGCFSLGREAMKEARRVDEKTLQKLGRFLGVATVAKCD